MNKRVLITGGTGNLGGHLRRRLLEMGYQVRIMSRGEPDAGQSAGVEWAVAQLVSGEGVREAVRGVDVIVHAASAPFPRAVEVEGGRHLIAAAQAEGVEHFVYVSIVGVDEIDFSYYDSKRHVEQMLADSGLPYSIQRATQFHAFVNQIIQALAKLPVILLPKGWRFQPLSADDVAARLAAIVENGPEGRAPDLAGPEVLTLVEMLTTWMEANGVRKPILRIPVPGGLSRGFREGHNLAPERALGGLTWNEYVQRQEASTGGRKVEAQVT